MRVFGLTLACAAVTLAIPVAGTPATHDNGTYSVYRPSKLSKSQPVPLVVACCGKLAESDTGLDRQADAHGFVIAYLSPTKLYNDAARARGPGPPFPDIPWLSSVIDQVRTSENVDPNAVYMTGGSAGAVFSYRAACDLSGKIAAIASVAGVDVVPGCKPANPVSVLEIHGTADTAVPYNGTSLVPSTPSTIAKWRGVDGCPSTSKVVNSGRAKDETWSGCNQGTAVELVTLAGVDHGWPHPPTYDASAAVWRFLSAHPRSTSGGGSGGGTAFSARLVSARVSYGKTRQVLTRITLGQPSSVRMTLLRGSRTAASRRVSAKAGTSTLKLGIPRSARPGVYSFKLVAKAGRSQRTFSKALRLRR